MHFFKFADRFVPIKFFEEDPITVTLKISDETDSRIVKVAEKIATADKLVNLEKRRQSYMDALTELIGKENASKILARADEVDCFAIGAVIHHVFAAYGEQKRKNLSASAR